MIFLSALGTKLIVIPNFPGQFAVVTYIVLFAIKKLLLLLFTFLINFYFQFASKSKWRQKHEEFVANIRAARKITAAQKAGEPLPPPPPAAVNPDYVQCPHCSRRFNEHAAERHIPFCKEQKSRLGNISSAKSSTLAKRNQVYKQEAKDMGHDIE